MERYKVFYSSWKVASKVSFHLHSSWWLEHGSSPSSQLAQEQVLRMEASAKMVKQKHGTRQGGWWPRSHPTKYRMSTSTLLSSEKGRNICPVYTTAMMAVFQYIQLRWIITGAGYEATGITWATRSIFQTLWNSARRLHSLHWHLCIWPLRQSRVLL